jgi:hypothetical protein
MEWKGTITDKGNISWVIEHVLYWLFVKVHRCVAIFVISCNQSLILPHLRSITVPGPVSTSPEQFCSHSAFYLLITHVHLVWSWLFGQDSGTWWQASYVTSSENVEFCEFSPEICSTWFRRITIGAQDENLVGEPLMTKESKKVPKMEYRSNSMYDLSYSLHL